MHDKKDMAMTRTARRAGTYNIRVVAEKGGVGKTTISVNLAIALANKGYKVLLGDADTINPAILYYLDLGAFKYASNDVYAGTATQDQATVHYGDTSLYVIPARPTYDPKLPGPKQLKQAYIGLKKEEAKKKYDFLITDTPPGFNPSSSIEFYGDMLVVANPSLPSAMSALKVSRLLTSKNKQHFLVCNRVSHSPTELSVKEIEQAYGEKAVAVIPDDRIVEEALHMKKPAVVAYPRSGFSKAINGLADFVEKRRNKKGA